MPIAVIHRKRKKFSQTRARRLRDALEQIIATRLEVTPQEVEVRIRKFSKNDINCPIVSIEIVTGTGKSGQRLRLKKQLALTIAEDVSRTNIIPVSEYPALGPYVWLRLVGSAFVPIGQPDLAR